MRALLISFSASIQMLVLDLLMIKITTRKERVQMDTMAFSVLSANITTSEMVISNVRSVLLHGRISF